MLAIIKRENTGQLAVYNGVWKWPIGPNSPNHVIGVFPGTPTKTVAGWFFDAIPDSKETRDLSYLAAVRTDYLANHLGLAGRLDDMPRRVWAYKNPDLETRDTYQILRDIDAKESGGGTDPDHTHSTPAGETGPVT